MISAYHSPAYSVMITDDITDSLVSLLKGQLQN